jgi:predicted esterase
MVDQDARNPHLGTETVSWGPDDAPLAVLALHGRGQSPEYMRGIAEQIDLEEIHWEIPTAHAGQWYGQKFMDPECLGGRELTQALEAVDVALDRLRERGHGPERTVVLGFSQGACLASQWFLAQDRAAAGLVLFTGGFIGEHGVPAPPGGSLAGVAALVSGPQDDAWVPLERMRETESALRDRGAAVTSLYLPAGEHTVTDSEIAAARTVLRNVREDALSGGLAR